MYKTEAGTKAKLMTITNANQLSNIDLTTYLADTEVCKLTVVAIDETEEYASSTSEVLEYETVSKTDIVTLDLNEDGVGENYRLLKKLQVIQPHGN